MRSPARRSHLNPSTAALSSSSSSLYVSFSSLLSSLSFEPLFTPSASLLPLLIVFLVLFQSLVVVASPITHSSPLTRQEKLVVERNASSRRNWDTGENRSKQEDMPQMDAPPRNLKGSSSIPEGWSSPPAKRPVFLVAKNNQFLYIKNGRITGTKLVRPKRGIVLFTSHNMSLVIQSLHDETFICMNASGDLYMSAILNENDCAIKESHLSKKGSHTRSYQFVGHSSGNQSFYLGIDCSPLKGTETKSEYVSSRFTMDSVTPEQARAAKEAVSNGDEESLDDAPLCRKKKTMKKQLLKEKKKLRAKWCRNFPRIKQRTAHYYSQCKKKYCRQVRSKKECVCQMMKEMVYNSQDTMRDCLAEHIKKWVKRQNARPNKKFIRTFAELLVPKFNKIMRRLRDQRRLKRKRQREREQRDRKKNEPKPTNTATPQHEQRRPSSGGRKRKRPKSKGVKLNFLLRKYFPQLSITPTTKKPRFHHVQRDAPSSSVSISGLSKYLADNVMSKSSSQRQPSTSSSSLSSSLSSSPSSQYSSGLSKSSESYPDSSTLSSSSFSRLPSASKSSPSDSSKTSPKSSLVPLLKSKKTSKHPIRHPRRHRGRRLNRKGKNPR